MPIIFGKKGIFSFLYEFFFVSFYQNSIYRRCKLCPSVSRITKQPSAFREHWIYYMTCWIILKLKLFPLYQISYKYHYYCQIQVIWIGILVNVPLFTFYFVSTFYEIITRGIFWSTKKNRAINLQTTLCSLFMFTS